MVTLVDTSVWIEFLRGSGSPKAKSGLTALLRSRTAAYTCPVLFELLLGARPHEELDVREALSFAKRIEFKQNDWEGAAQLGQRLARRGISVSSADIQIAFVAIQHEIALYTLDKHFEHIQKVVGDALQLRRLD